jgi:hypothetical protein
VREEAFFRDARFGGKLSRMTKETEAKWVERIREWRASGLSAEDFAPSKGCKASTLRWASSLLRRAAKSPVPSMPSSAESHSGARPERRTRSSGEAPRFLPVRTRPRTEAVEMVVEIGAARIRVLRGFDVTLLSEVVRALGGAGQ